jgi:ubiquinone/menaquinone biosynthesis C-methylase UbiE
VPEPEPSPRYDRLAEGYARHWGPVIRPAAEAVFDGLDPSFDPSRIVDIGAGTGTLAIAALRRWPAAEVAAIDPSATMLAIVEREVAALPGGAAARLRIHPAAADRMPFETGSIDLAISSFVLQLVPNRAAALREARRVLRPGGRFAWASWLNGGERFPADRVVDDILAEYGFDPPDATSTAGGDIASLDSAAAATRRAGFGGVRAERSELVHRWTPEGYLGMLTEFDEESLFADLGRGERRRIERRLLGALGGLSELDLTMRLPLVYVTGTAT